jgi:hypothetical protein
MDKSNLALVGALIAIVIAIGGYSFPQVRSAFGGISNFDQVDAADGFSVDGTTVIDGSGNVTTGTNSLTVGSDGTPVTGLNAGTCYIKPYAATIVASSTAQVDCSASPYGLSPLTGITFDDKVSVELSTSTAASGISAGINISGASASSTSGYLTLIVQNLTGAAYTWSTTANASGTATYIVADI